MTTTSKRVVGISIGNKATICSTISDVEFSSILDCCLVHNYYIMYKLLLQGCWQFAFWQSKILLYLLWLCFVANDQIS